MAQKKVPAKPPARPAQAKPARKKTFMSTQNLVILLAVFAVLAFLEMKPKPHEDAALARHFSGLEGCLVLQDLQTGAYTRYNAARAGQRLTPMSTFKVPHALIALDSGVADGPGFRLKWDGRERPFPAWNRDQTLASAIQGSVVWYFQELARRVGPDRMQPYLKSLNYGNADISGGIDRFWLDSTLLISAEEQVDFLRRLYKGELPLTARAQGQVKDMLRLAANGPTTLYGKTGTRLVQGQATLGWFVGWLERGGQAWVFALNLEAPEKADGPRARQTSEAILKDLKLW